MLDRAEVGDVKRIKTSRTKPKSHNSALSTKIELRRWLVEKLGGSPMILDCFCAEGMLWERAYDKTPRYLGLDIRQFNDERRTIVCDSRRYLRHSATQLERFDLFDLDAFGTPMEHLGIICNRLRLAPGKQVGFALTDCTAFTARMSGLPAAMLAYIGMARHKPSHVQDDYRNDIAGAVVAKAMKMAKLDVLEVRRARNERSTGGGQPSGGGAWYTAILAKAS